MKHIRNFSIIAHIDHGKSTLADRLIQHTQVVSDRKFRDQILDTMDIERERGITIKSQTVALPYTGSDGQNYMLNLIDTPGHVDFSYEVSRSLASCEGVLLLVDASQGVEAQTVANLYMAMEHDLEVIPVINKIDLPSADVDRVREMIENELALPADDAVLASGKTGAGVEDILEAVITRLPAPEGDPDGPLQALIFDSHYDPYRGTVLVVRVINGTLNKGDTIQMMATGGEYKVEEVGVTRITHHPQPKLVAGEVGYIIAGIKVISDTRVGDTITHKERPCSGALPGYQDVQPVVFSSIFPVSTDDYPDLIDAMEKLKLNDASLIYEKDSSAALGFGFRCGFLGLLHLEIVQERLERDFGQSIILTAPSVKYKITTTGGKVVWVDNPVLYPDPAHIDAADEPYISAKIILPTDFLGPIMQLCTDRRGNQVNMEYLDTRRVELTYELPLAEIVYDFYDRLKSLSRGYASFEYELADYRPTDLVKLDVLVNAEKVDALSVLLHRSNAIMRARQICERLKEEIPRQQFKIPIQGAIGGNIIARETISALRKDVLSKCYGGDISRKRKLLEKQKAGKKRMKMVGSVAIPQSAFLSVLKSSDN